MSKYVIRIIWRANDVQFALSTTQPAIKHTKQFSDYTVVGHQFHPDGWFSITYENGELEYFNRDSIFSIKTPKAE